MVNDGPSIAALARLVPAPSGEQQTDAAALLSFVHAIALPLPDAPRALRAIQPEHPEVGGLIDLWTVYRLRGLSRHDEASGLMSATVANYPESAAKHQHQYAITLRMMRRFQDAIAYETEHRPDILEQFKVAIDRLHGLTRGNEFDLAYAVKQPSRRLRLEILVRDLVSRAHTGGVEREEVLEFLGRAVDNGQRADHRQCLVVLGYLALKREDEFNALLDRIRTLQTSFGSTAPVIPHLLALRALHTGSAALARQAADGVEEERRGASWIPTEMWLEELGHPLPPMATQWLIPPEQVRANWRAIADGIIARAPE